MAFTLKLKNRYPATILALLPFCFGCGCAPKTPKDADSYNFGMTRVREKVYTCDDPECVDKARTILDRMPRISKA